MRKIITHYHSTAADVTAACGYVGYRRQATDPSLVTCGRCLAVLSKRCLCSVSVESEGHQCQAAVHVPRESVSHAYGNRPKVGDRVELHPATDRWMRGDRFGTVANVGTAVNSARVTLDRSGHTLVFPFDCFRIL